MQRMFGKNFYIIFCNFLSFSLQSPAMFLPASCCIQGDHFSGKPGNVREFDWCQGIDQKSRNCQGKLFIVNIKCLGQHHCLLAQYYHISVGVLHGVIIFLLLLYFIIYAVSMHDTSNRNMVKSVTECQGNVRISWCWRMVTLCIAGYVLVIIMTLLGQKRVQ